MHRSDIRGVFSRSAMMSVHSQLSSDPVACLLEIKRLCFKSPGAVLLDSVFGRHKLVRLCDWGFKVRVTVKGRSTSSQLCVV